MSRNLEVFILWLRYSGYECLHHTSVDDTLVRCLVARCDQDNIDHHQDDDQEPHGRVADHEGPQDASGQVPAHCMLTERDLSRYFGVETAFCCGKRD